MTCHKYFLTVNVILVTMFLCSGCEQQPLIRDYTEIDIKESRFDAIPAHRGIDRSMMQKAQSDVPSMDMSTADPAVQEMINASVVDVAISWQVPEGWNEEQSGGMRLATFRSEGQNAIECTIISLGGMAGGVQQNITRWMRQIGVNDISPDQLRQFIDTTNEVSTKTGETVAVFNFNTVVSSSDPNADSMMAGILEGASKTVFIKMTGSKAAIDQQEDAFTDLVQSIELK